jgi:hypothetical protein
LKTFTKPQLRALVPPVDADPKVEALVDDVVGHVLTHTRGVKELGAAEIESEWLLTVRQATEWFYIWLIRILASEAGASIDDDVALWFWGARYVIQVEIGLSATTRLTWQVRVRPIALNTRTTNPRALRQYLKGRMEVAGLDTCELFTTLHQDTFGMTSAELLALVKALCWDLGAGSGMPGLELRLDLARKKREWPERFEGQMLPRKEA